MHTPEVINMKTGGTRGRYGNPKTNINLVAKKRQVHANSVDNTIKVNNQTALPLTRDAVLASQRHIVRMFKGTKSCNDW